MECMIRDSNRWIRLIPENVERMRQHPKFTSQPEGWFKSDGRGFYVKTVPMDNSFRAIDCTAIW